MNKPSLPLELLRSLIEFVESPNIVVAAERLQISQPLLTKHLQELEKNLGEKLFQFEGRKKTLNRYGREFYQLVQQHLSDLDKEIQNLQLVQAQATKKTIRWVGRRELLERLAKNIRFDGIIEFVPMSGDEAILYLQNKEAEIAISQHPAESYNLMRRPLLRDYFVIIYPKVWNLKNRHFVDQLNMLLQKPYLSYGSSDSITKLLSHHDVSHGLKKYRSFPFWPSLVEMVENNQGWALVPKSYITKKNKLEILEVSEQALPATEFFIIYPKELSKYDWFKELLQQAQQIFKS